VATILLGTLVGQGLVIGVSPLLTRAYSPADFGALAILTALASIVGAGAPAGVDRALTVAPDRSVRGLVGFGLLVTAVVSTVTAWVAWGTRAELSELFSSPVLAELWWTIPVTVCAVSAQRIGTAVLARAQRHRAIAFRNASQGVAQTLWNLGMAVVGPVGLLGGLAAGRTAAVLGMLRTARPSTWPTPRAMVDAARAHRRFVSLTPWSAMLNVVGQQTPCLLLASMHGSVAAGFVALTMRVLGAPVGMVADAVAQYTAGALGARIRTGSSVRPVLVRLVVRLVVAGALAAGVVVVLGPTCFGVVFGAQWSVSGTYAQLLAPAFAVQVAVSPVTQVLSMLGRQSTQLGWDVGRLVAVVGAVFVPSILGAPMVVVLACLSGAMILAYAVVLVLVVRAVRHTDAHR
jgi:O-antigen/teichoic acid export membrane protein